jgi:hypothetical protein
MQDAYELGTVFIFRQNVKVKLSLSQQTIICFSVDVRVPYVKLGSTVKRVEFISDRMLYVWMIKKDKMGGACNTHGKFWLENLREIILECTLGK